MGKCNLRGPPQMVKYLFAGTFLLSLIIAIRALSNLMSEMGQLRIRQDKIDRELDTRRAEIPEKREKIETLQNSLSPLKREDQKLRIYFNKVINIESADAQQEREAQLEADTREHGRAGDLPERKREIQLSRRNQEDIF